MRVLVGLGNPGPRYFATRHNLGFELIDRFAVRHGIAVNTARFHGQLGEGEVAQQRVLLFKPMTFMNLSGTAVAELVNALPEFDVARELLLVYDDLDLPCGRLRVRKQGGAGGHNGVSHVVDALGTRQFPRLRFGVGRPSGGRSITEHVLSPFEPDERVRVDSEFAMSLELMETFAGQGVDAAMNRMATRDPGTTR